MTIKQVTTPKGRHYVHVAADGSEQKVPSVTTILGGALPKNGLDWWGFKLGIQAAMAVVGQGYDLDALYADAKATQYAPHKALKAAGSRGTDVHNVAEVLLRDGVLPALPPGTKADSGYVDALVAWHEAFGVDEWEVVAVEARMFSTEYLFAGTADSVCRRPDGVYVIGDFKTSKVIYESHLLQVAAYGHAAVEMGLIPADADVELHVVRLGEDGSYEVQRSRYTVDDFAAVLKVFHLLNDKTKKGVKLNAS